MPTLRIVLVALSLLLATTLSNAQTIISTGHIDVLQVTYDVGSGFSFQIYNDSTAITYDPVTAGSGKTFIHGTGAVFQLSDPHLANRPLNAVWNFIGNGPNDPFRVTPQNGDVGTRLELGFNTDSPTGGIDPGIFVNNEITITLVNKTGPGEFSMYTTSAAAFNDPVSGTPNVAISTFTNQTSFVVGTGSHGDLNWAFTQPGTYDLDFRVSGVLVSSNTTTSSQIHTYRFIVDTFAVPEPGTWVMIILGITGALTGFIFFRRYQLSVANSEV